MSYGENRHSIERMMELNLNVQRDFHANVSLLASSFDNSRLPKIPSDKCRISSKHQLRGIIPLKTNDGDDRRFSVQVDNDLYARGCHSYMHGDTTIIRSLSNM